MPKRIKIMNKNLEELLLMDINNSFDKALDKMVVKGVKVNSQKEMRAGTWRDLTPEEEVERAYYMKRTDINGNRLYGRG